MTGFDLPDNFLSNPEKLVGKKKAFITSSSAMSPTDKPITPAPTVLFAMAKTLRDYSTPAVANVLASSRWCRQVSSVACQAKMPTLTFSTSLSCATLSSSKTSHKTASGSVCFLSHGKGETVVLPEQGSCRHLEQVFRDIPR